MSELPDYKQLEILLTPELQALGRHVAEKMCPRGWGFVAMMFPFDGSAMLYVSNAQRADIVKALREFTDKLESGEA